jgi:hypothetical protein
VIVEVIVEVVKRRGLRYRIDLIAPF